MAVEDIGVLVPTKIPGLADAADIQEALRVYHYGGTGYEATAAQTSLPAVGIARRLLEITDDITSLENRPSSGGDVATTAPVAGSFTPSGIPNGYIWVDSDGTLGGGPTGATAVFTNSAPTTSITTGTIWVDKDSTDITANPFIPTATINAKGDLLVGSANDSIVTLSAGTNGQVLKANSASTSGLEWAADNATDATKVPLSTVTAKGDLIAASGSGAVTNLAVGNNGETLVADSSTSTGLRYQATMAAGKNCLINGGFDIWQRGTTSSGNAYICDRWYSALVSGTGTFAQESTVVPTGSTYSMKFTASATAQPALYQAIETANAIKFAGKTVTVSGVVAASASTGFTIDVQHSSSTDNGVTGTWTSITATSGGTATATSTTFVSISGVYAIPSTAKSLRVRIFTTSTIANAVVVYFDNAQLELGSTATAFQTATGTIQGELAACQRYYWRMVTGSANPMGNGSAYSASQVQLIVQYPVTMRVAPALDMGTGTDYFTFVRNGGSDTFNSFTIDSPSTTAANIYNNTQISSTAGNGGVIFSNNASAYLGFTSEL